MDVEDDNRQDPAQQAEGTGESGVSLHAETAPSALPSVEENGMDCGVPTE